MPYCANQAHVGSIVLTRHVFPSVLTRQPQSLVLYIIKHFSLLIFSDQYVRMVTYTENNCPNAIDTLSRPILTLISRDQYDQVQEPMIYFITPTYRRAQQKPEFVRLTQTLMQVIYSLLF